MNIFRELIKFIYWISLLIFKDRDKTQKHKQIEAPTPVVDVYYAQALGRFQDTYRKYTPAEMNANIDAAFYNVSEFKKAVELPDNELELAWRRRQVNLRTPRGNVIMYYDAFKLGFAYYSDHFMPYKMLNAIAMKYVVTYRCRDFFVDETVFSDHKSTLIDVHINEKQPTNTNNNANTFVVPKDAPMAKLKSQRLPPVKIQPTTTNRFINLGGVRNYKPLIEPKKVNPMNGFKSDAMPTPVMTYKQYKQQGIQLM
jgi:hypothetical protein